MLKVRSGGILPYEPVASKMRGLVDSKDRCDQFWVLQHLPVYTTGVRSSPLPKMSHIPVVHSDRGGLITYHGPGQLILYCMVDVRKCSVRNLVRFLEQSMLDTLNDYGIKARQQEGSAGVFIGGEKVGFVGLRIRRGFSFHGIGLNVSMDLSPFDAIDSCGLDCPITQISHFYPQVDIEDATRALIDHTQKRLGYQKRVWTDPLLV